MNVAALKKFCLAMPGATERLHLDPVNVLVYKVAGRNFAYFKTSDPEKWRFSVRVTPERFLELTDRAGVKPARYMARFHWVTIVAVRNFPDAYLQELINWSYQKALLSVGRKKRVEIIAQAAASAIVRR